MYRTVRLLLPAVAALLLASCQSVPEHARFIPKDALVVLGVHTGEMRKSLAWSAITGSSLLDEMRKAGGSGQAPEMLKDAENAGIDFGSTLYFYSKPDTRFAGKARMALVFPVSDDEKLTAYIRKHVPGAAIRKVGERSEAMVDGKVYIGWNDEVMIAMNTVMGQLPAHEPVQPDSMPGSAENFPSLYPELRVDSAATASEMDSAFNPAKNASIAGNKHFKKLQHEDHDITMWVAYDQLMDAYGRQGGLMGMTMGNTLWAGSAMAAGFDFEKGRVDGAMRYYASDSMRAVMKELGKEQIDPDMLRRLPAAGLNLAAGYHLAPKALKLMLDKMGVTGMANLALMQQGLSVDDILGAISGDMVVSLNNFRVETRLQEIDSVTQREFDLTPQPINSPKLDFVYALKIGDKGKMTKLLGFLTSSELMQQVAPNTYRFPATADGPTLVIGDKYVAISSSAPGAQAFLNEKAGDMPAAVKEEIAGHPVGMWADIRSFMAGAKPVAVNGGADSAAFNTIRNLFTTFTAGGGEFKDDASVYHMSLSFSNKEGNSLVQLLHLAQQLAALKGAQAIAYR